jgi:hypothetical protein
LDSAERACQSFLPRLRKPIRLKGVDGSGFGSQVPGCWFLKGMISRFLFYGGFLVAVAVLPYFSSQWLKASRTTDGSAQTSSAAFDGGLAAGTPNFTSPAGAPPINAARSDSPPIVPMAEAITFDVTPSWLYGRWPRVTTGLPEGDLQGYRVPLVTGTREDDVAGSLTYYFTARQTCQRITFQGTTGDPRKVIAHIVGRFGLIERTSNDPGTQLYQTRWNGKPVSELRIKAAPVVSASAPLARYEVQWTLNSWARK